MTEKIFDLNGRDKCVTAAIIVADKEFRISRVVTGVRVIYSNYLIEMGALLKELGSFDAEHADRKEIDECTRKANDFAGRKTDVLHRCLELLLTRNGYEFDRSWWDENTDEHDVRAFIDACFSKDSTESVKKK